MAMQTGVTISKAILLGAAGNIKYTGRNHFSNLGNKFFRI